MCLGGLADPPPLVSTALSTASLSLMIKEALKGVLQEQKTEASGDPGPSATTKPTRKRSRSRDSKKSRSSRHGDGSGSSDSDSSQSSPTRQRAKGFVPMGQPRDDMSLSSQSDSAKEEGELSGDEDQVGGEPQKVDHLCPPDLYPRVLGKSAHILDMELPTPPQKANTPSSRAKQFPQGPPQATGRAFSGAP